MSEVTPPIMIAAAFVQGEARALLEVENVLTCGQLCDLLNAVLAAVHQCADDRGLVLGESA